MTSIYIEDHTTFKAIPHAPETQHYACVVRYTVVGLITNLIINRPLEPNSFIS